MAKSIYTREERKAQCIKAGVKIANKDGILAVSGRSVANEVGITGPLVFHIFGTRDKLRKVVMKNLSERGKDKAIKDLAAFKARSTKRAPGAKVATVRKPTVTAPRKPVVVAPKVRKPTVTAPRKRSIKEIKAIKDKAAATAGAFVTLPTPTTAE